MSTSDSDFSGFEVERDKLYDKTGSDISVSSVGSVSSVSTPTSSDTDGNDGDASRATTWSTTTLTSVNIPPFTQPTGATFQPSREHTLRTAACCNRTIALYR